MPLGKIIDVTARRFLAMARGQAPGWARSLQDSITSLHRKVNLIMALNLDTLNRILAGAASLIEQAKAAAVREAAKDQHIKDLEAALNESNATLTSERAADAAEDTDANTALTNTATALDDLLKGPETPETPAVPAPADAPGVISGDTPVESPVVVDDPVFAPDPSTDDAGALSPSTDAPVPDPVNPGDSSDQQV
jgi:hypothetical protein